ALRTRSPVAGWLMTPPNTKTYCKWLLRTTPVSGSIGPGPPAHAASVLRLSPVVGRHHAGTDGLGDPAGEQKHPVAFSPFCSVRVHRRPPDGTHSVPEGLHTNVGLHALMHRPAMQSYGLGQSVPQPPPLVGPVKS